MSPNKDTSDTPASTDTGATKKTEKIFTSVKAAGHKVKEGVDGLVDSFNKKIDLHFTDDDTVPEFSESKPGDASAVKPTTTRTATASSLSKRSKGRRVPRQPAEDSEPSAAESEDDAVPSDEDEELTKDGKRIKQPLNRASTFDKKTKSGAGAKDTDTCDDTKEQEIVSTKPCRTQTTVLSVPKK